MLQKAHSAPATPEPGRGSPRPAAGTGAYCVVGASRGSEAASGQGAAGEAVQPEAGTVVRAAGAVSGGSSKRHASGAALHPSVGRHAGADAEMLQSLLQPSDEDGTDALLSAAPSSCAASEAALTQQWRQLEKAWQRNWWV